MKAGPAEPVTEAVPEKGRVPLPDGTILFWFGEPVGPATPVPAELVLFLDRVEDEKTPELNGRPVPVELGRDVELVNLPRVKEEERMPELNPPVGLMLPLGLKLLKLDIERLGVAGRVELVELLLRREEEPPVGAVTPVMKPEPDGLCAYASLAIAKATRTMSKLNFMIAGNERD